ncbi:acyclic terpene utilization AtuA family protein [Ottowia sp. VDI28]|uniref:acyclic terpene utilization AtuA family protein n=1 Tax=Ottowia sp. VDI28 TaxID=3133968 RepID=UPI003C2BF0B0
MDRQQNRLRIGVGAGMADDRIGPALQLLERCDLDYLVCECLAERTIARETLTLSHDPAKGFNPMLGERMRAFLPLCQKNGVRLVSNMGAANPVGAARAAREIGNTLGWHDLKCAAVVGDDVKERISKHPELPLMDRQLPLEDILPRLASANAYLGADVVRDALATGAHVVMTGRVADPSLFLGVALHHHGWSYDDLPRLASGTIMGHLLECSAQVTGGYFADPGKKDVPRLAELPYPFADILPDGELFIGKPEGSGGRLDRMTCSEQALYEIHDPDAYITPDCVLSLNGLHFEEAGPDRVAVRGASARKRTDSYKVVVGYFDGWIGSGEVAYAGPNALARAQLAADIVKERFRLDGGQASEIQVDLIGMNSLHGSHAKAMSSEPYEVRLRVAARCSDKKSAHLIGDHVRQLNMQGPYGAGGPLNHGAKEVIAVDGLLIPRDWVSPQIITLGV